MEMFWLISCMVPGDYKKLYTIIYNVIEHLHRWSRGMTLAFQANKTGFESRSVHPDTGLIVFSKTERVC